MAYIRSHGCRDLLVYFGSPWCNHSAKFNADRQMKLWCGRCVLVCLHCLRLIGADVRPDWIAHAGGAGKVAHSVSHSVL
jgi:hypothetical protein